MSSLWDVSVVNRGERWVDLLVQQGHPDAGAVPLSRGFALQLVLVPAYGFDDAYDRVPTGPLGEAVPFDSSYDAEEVAEFADTYVASVTPLKVVGTPWDEAVATAKTDQAVLARGIERGSDGWDDAWTDAWREFWANPENLPRAWLRIEVTDPKWLAHVTPGQAFESAGGCSEGPWVDRDLDAGAPTPADAWVAADRVEFARSHVPRQPSMIDHDLIRRLAQPKGALGEAVSAHARFLASGGAGGRFELLEAGGLPLCVYVGGQAADGAQLVLRLTVVDPAEPALAGADLRFADLSGAIADRVSLAGARLDDAVVTDTSLEGASFAGASLRRADLSRANLRGASFRDADLREADFENADCSGADFRGARLTGAKFPGTVLDGILR